MDKQAKELQKKIAKKFSLNITKDKYVKEFNEFISNIKRKYDV
tara:strand:- start:568 stop:696 length:129 start_codon:yes stop_codon:yes gene_type:complete